MAPLPFTPPPQQELPPLIPGDSSHLMDSATLRSTHSTSHQLSYLLTPLPISRPVRGETPGPYLSHVAVAGAGTPLVVPCSVLYGVDPSLGYQ